MICNRVVALHLWYALVHGVPLMLPALQAALPVLYFHLCSFLAFVPVLVLLTYCMYTANTYSAISPGAQMFMLHVLQCNDSFTEQVSPVTF